MLGLTLVAGYGAKPSAFKELVRELQAQLSAILEGAFEPYAIEQVHGTIVGLEGTREPDAVLNANFLRLRGERRVMDLERALALLDGDALPLRIRVGGFAASNNYSITSQGQHPYERSFSLRGGLATVIGWPAASDGRVRVLDELRRRFAEANVLHKYHATDTDVDDDFYFVLGKVDTEEVEAIALADAELAMREQLATREPVIFELGPEDFSVVAYEDPMLPLESSRAFALSGALGQLEKIAALG